MADTADSAATGGFLVILGIIVAVLIGIVVMRGNVFHHSDGPEIKVELPAAAK